MTAADPKTTETHRAVIQNVAISVFLGTLVLLYAFFLTFFPGFSTGVIHSDFLLSLSLAGALVLLIKSIHPDRAKQVFFPPAVSVLLLLNAAFFPLQAGLITLPPAAFSGPAPLSGWVLSDLLTAGIVVGLLARHYFRPKPAGKVSWPLWGGELALFFLTAWFGPQLTFPGLANFINSWWGAASYYGLAAALWTMVAGFALAAWRQTEATYFSRAVTFYTLSRALACAWESSAVSPGAVMPTAAFFALIFSGECFLFSGLLLDRAKNVTLEKAAQSHLENAQKELSQRTRSIEKVNQDLENQIAQKQIQSDLNVLLTLSLENHPLPEMLKNLMNYLTSQPWLALNGNWGIYLKERSDAPLQLRYVSQLPDGWPKTFASLSYPNCLCGASPDILSGQACTLSFSHQSGRSLLDHPHYGLPLLNSQTQPIGHLVLFAVPGSTPNPLLQAYLLSVANILVGVIQRKQSEEELRRERDKSNQYLANAGLMFLILNTEGKIQFINRKGCEILGWTSQDIIGRDWFPDYLPERIRGEVEGFFKNLVTHGKKDTDYFFENPVVNRSGQERLLAWHWTLLTDGDGTLQAVLASGEDITQQKHLQSQLLQAQKLESIGQLASGIAHEINTPIQYVGDNLRFLSESFDDLSKVIQHFPALIESVKAERVTPGQISETESLLAHTDLAYLTEEIPKAVDQALEGVERVATIVRAMKEFAHPDTAEITPLNLNHAIESTITISRNEWKYVADLETDFDYSLPEVPCLPGEFNQVILNMLVNAAHTIADALGPEPDHKGIITIKTGKEDGWAVIRISDTGMGIAPEVLPKVFSPFFTTKKVGRGSGQGLAICHNVIVEKLKGAIDVETELGKGTTFSIRLPMLEAGTEKSAALLSGQRGL